MSDLTDSAFRWKNPDLVYSKSKGKITLTLDVEGIDDKEPSDEMVFFLLVDYLATLCETNERSPKEAFEHCLQHRMPQ